MKTIDYEDWVKDWEEPPSWARFILERFDLTELKRRKRAPARARGRRPPRRGRG